MKNNINTTLEEFSRKYLSPTQNEQSVISARYVQLQKLLPGSEIFQSGSYPRCTAVSPVHDLDVIWVMPEEWQQRVTKAYTQAFNKQGFTFDVSQPLKELADYLREQYRKIGVKVEIDDTQRHAVKISFPEKDSSKDSFTIDVVPAVKSGRKNAGNDVYLVPEIQKATHSKWEKIANERGGRVKWILSDPKYYLDQAKEINDSNSSYRKAVKFIKTWRRACNAGLVDFELQSFHLEQVLAQMFLEDNTLDTLQAVKSLFTDLGYWMAEPRISDAANPDVFIDSYLTKDLNGTQRKEAAAFAAKSLHYLNQLDDDSTFADVYKATRLMLIAPPPWPRHIGSISKIEIACEVERLKKMVNLQHYSKKYTALSKESLAEINGPRPLSTGEKIKPGYQLKFTPVMNVMAYDEIKWLIVNTGTDALEKKRIRGWRGFEFNDCNKDANSRIEYTEYIGEHWVECHVIQDGQCIGFGRFYVNIYN